MARGSSSYCSKLLVSSGPLQVGLNGGGTYNKTKGLINKQKNERRNEWLTEQSNARVKHINIIKDWINEWVNEHMENQWMINWIEGEQMIHLFICSFTCSFIHLFTLSLVHSLFFNCSFCHFVCLLGSFIQFQSYNFHSLAYYSFIVDTFIITLILLVIHRHLYVFICKFVLY